MFVMTKSVLQKILIRLVLLATGLVLSSQVWGQGWDIIYANQTEGIRLRQMNGSQSKDSLSVKTTSNTIIWNSWGIGQTSEKFLNTKNLACNLLNILFSLLPKFPKAHMFYVGLRLI